jgi:hypothetical protein
MKKTSFLCAVSLLIFALFASYASAQGFGGVVDRPRTETQNQPTDDAVNHVPTGDEAPSTANVESVKVVKELMLERIEKIVSDEPNTSFEQIAKALKMNVAVAKRLDAAMKILTKYKDSFGKVFAGRSEDDGGMVASDFQKYLDEVGLKDATRKQKDAAYEELVEDTITLLLVIKELKPNVKSKVVRVFPFATEKNINHHKIEERQKLLAESRELLEAEIQQRIREEFRNANLNGAKIIEKITENILSMVTKDTTLKVSLSRLALWGEEQNVEELVAKSVLQAYRDKIAEAGRVRMEEAATEAVRQERAKEQQANETAAIYKRIKEEAEKIEDTDKFIEKLREIGVRVKNGKCYFLSESTEVSLGELNNNPRITKRVLICLECGIETERYDDLMERNNVLKRNERAMIILFIKGRITWRGTRYPCNAIW